MSAEALSALLDRDHQRLVILTRGCGEHGHSGAPQPPADTGSDPGCHRLGGAIQGPENKAWMDQHFQHLDFDTELNRRTLMAVTDPGASYEDASEQCFPVPPVPPSGWAPIESVDLGPLPLADQDPEVMARALWVLLCFCVSTR